MNEKLKRTAGNVKKAAILSYILVILNALYGLIITPYVVGRLGNIEYGVYKTIVSFSSSLMILDLGIGGTLTRYIAKYKVEKDEDGISSIISMVLCEGIVLITFVAVVCGVIYTLLPTLYSNGLSGDEINLAKKLFSVLAINICFHIFENYLNGIISGYNQFEFGNTLKIVRLLLRIFLTYIVLAFVRSSMVLVIIDLTLTIALIIVEYIFIRLEIKQKIRILRNKWDNRLFIESFKYTGLLFLTSIASQINSNLDNVVIGAQLGANQVTVYSMALLVFAMFENLSTAISGVMLPTVTNAIHDDPSGRKAIELVTQAGRVQFMLLGAVWAGFLVLGKEFLVLWLGHGYEDAYTIALILMTPALLELCVNVCLSILRAKNLLGFRTTVLSISMMVNAFITIVGVRYFGYYAAAVGTAVSFLCGSVIVMGIYYIIKLNIDIIKMYIEIFKRTWLCIAISTVVVYFSSTYLSGSWINLIINVFIFAIIYGLTLWIFGLNKKEKETFLRRSREK